MALIACVCFWPVAQDARAQSPSVQESLQLLESAVQAIHSYDVWIEATNKQLLVQEYILNEDRTIKLKSSRKLAPGELPETNVMRYRQVFQRGKARWETYDSEGNIRNTIVSDGEVQKNFDQRATAGIGRPSPQPVPDGANYACAYRAVLGIVEASKVFRQRGNATLRPVDKTGLLTLDSAPVPGTTHDVADFGFRVTLDPAWRCMPVVVECYQLHEGKPRTNCARRVVGFRMVDGVPVPIRFKTQFFDHQAKQTYGEVGSEMESVVDVARSSWNREVPQSTFELKLPAGVQVIDQRNKTMFVTGKQDAGKNLEDLAKNAKDVIPVSTEGYMSPEKPKSRPWLYWAVAAGIGSAAIAVVVALYRRRRMKGA
jgi:hypothetical protein